MQILKTPPVDLSSSVEVEHHSQSGEMSCANSTISIDYQELELASTIGGYSNSSIIIFDLTPLEQFSLKFSKQKKINFSNFPFC
jgi:hypothetical protein